MVVGIRCGLNHRGCSLKPGTKPVLIWKSIISSNFSELSRYFSTFLITNISLILTIKKNPVLQLGINNGLMMAAERLLESNMSIDKVVILLRLDANQEKNYSYEIWQINRTVLNGRFIV